MARSRVRDRSASAKRDFTGIPRRTYDSSPESDDPHTVENRYIRSNPSVPGAVNVPFFSFEIFSKKDFSKRFLPPKSCDVG
jgi:hypothetical protein